MKDILKYAEFFKHEGTRRALKARRTDLLASPYYYLVLYLSPIQRNLDFIVKKKPGSYLLSRECSIIGVGGLNFRVRDGNGCDTSTMATKQE